MVSDCFLCSLCPYKQMNTCYSIGSYVKISLVLSQLMNSMEMLLAKQHIVYKNCQFPLLVTSILNLIG